jgi:uncharacterized protein YbjT (DUF2867 family)
LPGDRAAAILPPMVIAVMGATGKSGRTAAERLLSAGVTVRALGRSRQRLEPLVRRGAESAVVDLDDPEGVARALKGADALFTMIPADYRVPDVLGQYRRMAEAIAAGVRAAGVRRVALVSSLGAEHASGTGPIVGLHRAEQTLEGLPGVDRLFLRAGYFYENFLGSIGLIKQAGINGDMAPPDRPVPMVEPGDLGIIGADALVAGDFKGTVVREVIGPRLLTMTEATRILGAAIGKPELPYVQFPESDYVAALERAGLAPDAARLLAEMNLAAAAGKLRVQQERTPRNTGLTSFERFAEDFALAYHRS